MGGDVAVVIVNWNGKEYLEPCLRAVLAQTYHKMEVVVVDNGSTDGSAELVVERFPQVRLIRSSTNLGFAAGCNLGVTASTSEYIATLNPDTRSEPEWLKSLVQGMETDRRIGMCASLMLRMDQPNVVDSAGIALDGLGIAWDRLGGQPATEAAAAEAVFGPCAGAALYRREMWDALGGFDEDFFMYLEDVDLAWRAQTHGWRCLYVPSARVYHQHSAAAVEGSPFKNFLKARNKIWLITKNYPYPQFLLWAPLILLYDLMAVGVACFKGNFSALRGRLAALCGLRRAIAKRQPVSPTETRGWVEVRRLICGVQSPWLIWRRYAHLSQHAMGQVVRNRGPRPDR